MLLDLLIVWGKYYAGVLETYCPYVEILSDNLGVADRSDELLADWNSRVDAWAEKIDSEYFYDGKDLPYWIPEGMDVDLHYENEAVFADVDFHF